MTRPSRNTDRLLIEAALELIPKTGFTNLKVRDVAKKAGVNLGMFSYHFKTKEKFIEVLLSEVYEDFFNKLTLETESEADCLDRLRVAIQTIALFVRDHRKLIIPFVEEFFMGNQHIMTFARKNMTRHVSVIISMVRECQKKKYIIDIPLWNVIPIFMGAVVGPTFIVSVMDKFVKKGVLRNVVTESLNGVILSDKAIRQRVDIAIKGLSTGAVK